MDSGCQYFLALCFCALVCPFVVVCSFNWLCNEKVWGLFSICVCVCISVCVCVCACVCWTFLCQFS